MIFGMDIIPILETIRELILFLAGAAAIMALKAKWREYERKETQRVIEVSHAVRRQERVQQQVEASWQLHSGRMQ